MDIQPYYINKTSDTSADTLLAIGFASLLVQVLRSLGKPSKGLTIEDAGPYHEVRLPTSITDGDLQHLKPFSPLRLLVTATQIKKQAEKQGKQLDGFFYEAEQEKSSVYYAKFKTLEAALRTPEARLNRSRYPILEELVEPDPQLGHYRAIQQMRIAGSFNDLLQRWADLEELQREHIRLLLTLFGSPDNDIAAAIAAWQKLAKEHDLKGNALVTSLQLVNPTAGKGANRSKSSTLAEGNQDGFWLLELLKFVGFMDAAAPYVIRGSKDRKTYVLQPRIIELGTLQGMMRTFRAVCWSSTVVKLDIMAALRFAQTFVTLREQALKGQAEEDEFSNETQLYSIAQGFEVLSFKDMGSAYATMNVACINFPQWLPKIKTSDDADHALALLKEHLQIIQQIRNSKGEEGSEEYELLRFYRDFLSGHDLILTCVLRDTSKMREVRHRAKALGIGFQLIESITHLVNDLIERGKSEICQVLFAHFFPDMFDRIEFGTVGRLSNQAYIGRDLQIFGVMPSSSIDLHHHKVLCKGAGHMLQKHIHHLGIGRRQNERGHFALCWRHRRIDVGVLAHDVMWRARSDSRGSPGTSRDAHAAEAGFIFGHL
jgi:hypothetical protein